MNTINGHNEGMKSNTNKTATSRKGANVLSEKDSIRLNQLLSGNHTLKQTSEKSQDDGNLFAPRQGGYPRVIYGAEPPIDIKPVYAAETPIDIKPVYAAETPIDIKPVYAAETPIDIKPVYAAETPIDIKPVYAAETPIDIKPVYAAETPIDIKPVYAAETPADDQIVSEPKSIHDNRDSLKLDTSVLMELFTKLSHLLSLFSSNSTGRR